MAAVGELDGGIRQAQATATTAIGRELGQIATASAASTMPGPSGNECVPHEKRSMQGRGRSASTLSASLRIQATTPAAIARSAALRVALAQREQAEQAVDERAAAVRDGGLERVQPRPQAGFECPPVRPFEQALLAGQPAAHACAVPRLRRTTR